MSSLTFQEKIEFEKLFNMETGYVLDFSNPRFQRFIGETINIDIYGDMGYEEYCSKAKKLRQIWDNEPDVVVGNLLYNLLIHYENNSDNVDKEKAEKLKLVSQRLIGNATVELPIKKEETLAVLLEDIKGALSKNNPALILDRLHTFSIKFLRQICIKHDIKIENEKGISFPLHSLIGMLKNFYQQNNIFQSEFIILALQQTITIFEKFNDIRNNRSYAHDNEILNVLEADFVVRIMSTILVFIDNIENEWERSKKTEQSYFDDDIPF